MIICVVRFDPTLLCKANFEAKRYNECITALTKGIHIAPHELKLWYNLALAQEEFAVATLGASEAASAKRWRMSSAPSAICSELNAFLDTAVPKASKKGRRSASNPLRTP
ncbi:hypothetical protein Ae201684P_000969 [Aphanomyces euteiches]|uniref:Uncharacterized protein n=1 Tax=Aphanomyces euteiches TaxID=100861 RepID=A0A6G0WQ88_9STRA|nr:hypothetical protein Ae201684_012804 [Aphanomyces euteiches]KAH9097491.1 hypothetical protein Ae201684P_000969 [Aphanomyces euteiches]KAH9138541.1 hypothetical protein AeRB84_017146 [Aphanomyces euteiches]